MAYWIDTGTGTPTDPGTTAVISAVRQYATEGGLGVPPTIPGAEWFNMITDEVLAVLSEAGITPDKASHTQLRDAIKRVVVNAAATQAEVNESNPVNQLDSKFVTPKTLWGWVKQSTETVLGMMKVATQAQTNAGSDDDVAVTPLKMRAGFSILIANNGYIFFPAWLGSFAIQWGRLNVVYTTSSLSSHVTFPISFPNTTKCVFLSRNAQLNNSLSVSFDEIATSLASTGFDLVYASSSGPSPATDVYWVAFGN